MSNVTVEKCLEIIGEFEPSTQGRKLGQLGIDGKFVYIGLKIFVNDLSLVQLSFEKCFRNRRMKQHLDDLILC